MNQNTVQAESVPVRYNGHQLDKVAVNIDFLVLNLKGTMVNPESIYNERITIKPNPYGTKVFSASHQIEYDGHPIATMLSVPRSPALPSDLCQLQFGNHHFYTKHLHELRTFIYELTEITNLHFVGINRLDIAVDACDNTGFFSSIIQDVVKGTFRLGGRSKAISKYYETHEGKSVFNGFTIGKRSSSRFLRVYNKSAEIRKKPKEYITENWKANGLEAQNIWRFEYQLNNSFFRNLKETSFLPVDGLPSDVVQDFTWSVFDRYNLVRLLEMAQKNHFELKFDTGKTEANKEKTFPIFDFKAIRERIQAHKITKLQRLKRVIEPSDIIQKRTLRGLMREYYNSGQSVAFILPINEMLLSYKVQTSTVLDVMQFDPYSDNQKTISIRIDDDSLETWLMSKVHFFVSEFQSKAVKPVDFDFGKFYNHLKIFL